VNILSHILVGFGLSYIGSLPFGIINMTVAHTAINKNLRAAVWVSLGAILVEFFQVILALKFTWLFNENNGLNTALKTVAIIVFLLGGAYYMFFAKSRSALSDKEDNHRSSNEFFKGIILSLLNVMAIPFWIFYGAFLTSNGLLIRDNLYVLVFAGGSMIGTFSLFMSYALLGHKILRKHDVVTKWVNRVIGAVLLVLGFYQIAGMAGWI
jgi:threonine/homoserine/homoserine lactone efflux protein